MTHFAHSADMVSAFILGKSNAMQRILVSFLWTCLVHLRLQNHISTIFRSPNPSLRREIGFGSAYAPFPSAVQPLDLNRSEHAEKDVMNRCFTPLAAIVLGSALLPLTTQADCGGAATLSVTITNLPEIEFSGFQVFGLNQTGQITGFFYVSGEHPSHAFIFDAGNLLDLGTLGGDSGQANAINNAGHLAGEAQPLGSLTPHAFSYDGTTMADLGTLG